MIAPPIALGQPYKQLCPLYELKRHVRPGRWFVCACMAPGCQNLKAVRASDLRAGKVASCGCLYRAGAAARLRQHRVCGSQHRAKLPWWKRRTP